MIRSKQQFKSLLAKELGYEPGPVLLPKNRFTQYHKPVKLSDGSTGYITLVFENVGDPYLGEQALLVNMAALLLIPGPEHYTRSTFTHWWIGGLSEDILKRPVDPKIFAAFNVSSDTEFYSQGVSTIERYQKIKTLISELEKTDFFKNRLEELLQTYRDGIKVKDEIIDQIPKLLPEFKYTLDEYNERGYVVFYTDPIKGKVLSPVIQIRCSNPISFSIGKGKIENGEFFSNPKDIMYRYFYRNSPKYMDDPSNGWKYENIDEALEEFKNFVASYKT